MAALLRIFSPFRVYPAIQEIEYITLGCLFAPHPLLGNSIFGCVSFYCPLKGMRTDNTNALFYLLMAMAFGITQTSFNFLWRSFKAYSYNQEGALSGRSVRGLFKCDSPFKGGGKRDLFFCRGFVMPHCSSKILTLPPKKYSIQMLKEAKKSEKWYLYDRAYFVRAAQCNVQR